MKTALYESHVALGARIVDFAGWDMPLHYGSQIEEHHAVRNEAGCFDVSHMTVVDVHGGDAEPYLRFLLANDVARLDPDRALYSAMLDEAGGVLDDLIVYRLDDRYRVVVNAATRDKDLRWMEDRLRSGPASYDAIVEERADLGIIAVQGPRSIDAVSVVCALPGLASLPAFALMEHDGLTVARTGYTGEDGVEIVLPEARAAETWEALVAHGVRPIGLGARDTLRLEAGLNLYGQDMDESTSPLVSNIGWTVAWKPTKRDFVGRAALEAERAAGVGSKLTGLVLDSKGVMRNGFEVRTEAGSGVITSGIISPTLGVSIALARVPADATGTCEVDIRGRPKPARLVKPPFVRRGEKVYK